MTGNLIAFSCVGQDQKRSIASNLISGHSGIAATGVALADLPAERAHDPPVKHPKFFTESQPATGYNAPRFSSIQTK
jgi:hypothetical protein